MSHQDDEDNWKAMYEESTSKLKHLEQMSKDVVKEYDELMKKNKDLEIQNEDLHKKVQDQKQQLSEVKSLIEPALVEYNQLENKYEIEKGCRHNAETYASQIVQQNKKLKRQSMDLIGMMNKSQTPLVPALADINIDDEEEDKKIENEYQDSLNNTIRELKNEVAQLKASLSKNMEDLQAEQDNYKWASSMYKSSKEQLHQTEQSLKQHKEAMKQLSTVSEAAYNEYESLQNKYKLEVKRRSIFEKKIEEVAVQNNKMKRQSEVLLMKLTPGDQLHKALMEIEDLTEKLNEQRKFYDAEIDKLQSQIGTQPDNVDAVSESDGEKVDEQRQALEAEKEELLKQIKEYEDKYAKLELVCDDLRNTIEEAKRPPPPPPPPPPPAVHTSKGFLSKILKKKKVDRTAALQKSGAPVNTDFNKALDEMMENIKRGKSLRPTLKPVKAGSNPDGSSDFRMILKSKSFDDCGRSQSVSDATDSQNGESAMNELQNIMRKMKRTNSESDLLSPIESSAGDSELAKAFRRVKKSPSVDSIDSDVQIRNKLSLVEEERESEVMDDVFKTK